MGNTLIMAGCSAVPCAYAGQSHIAHDLDRYHSRAVTVLSRSCSRSRDGGATWPREYEVVVWDETLLAATSLVPEGPAVCASSDQGESWQFHGLAACKPDGRDRFTYFGILPMADGTLQAYYLYISSPTTGARRGATSLSYGTTRRTRTWAILSGASCGMGGSSPPTT